MHDKYTTSHDPVASPAADFLSSNIYTMSHQPHQAQSPRHIRACHDLEPAAIHKRLLIRAYGLVALGDLGEVCVPVLHVPKRHAGHGIVVSRPDRQGCRSAVVEVVPRVAQGQDLWPAARLDEGNDPGGVLGFEVCFEVLERRAGLPGHECYDGDW